MMPVAHKRPIATHIPVVLHRVRSLFWLFFLFYALGCTPNFVVTSLTDENYPPTSDIAIIYDAPSSPYVIVASFEGKSDENCPPDISFCHLRLEAARRGAHAIWITHSDKHDYPGDWIMVQGRLTRLYPHHSARLRGNFVRFLSDPVSPGKVPSDAPRDGQRESPATR